MMRVWLLFMFTMAAVMGRGHGGDGAEDPPFPGGRGPGQYEQVGKSYHEFLFTIFVQLS